MDMPATTTKIEDLDDLFSLKGKNAVVVGGAGGIGRGLAGGLLRYGAQVAIADINLSALETAVAELQEFTTGAVVRSYRVDTGQESSVAELVANASADMGGRMHVSSTLRASTSKPPPPSFLSPIGTSCSQSTSGAS